MVDVVAAKIEDLINSIENFSTISQDSIAKIEIAINNLVKNQLALGQTPYGETWLPNKDGSKSLKGIEKYVHVTASSSGIKIFLDEPATFHNSGSKNLPKRQIIPQGLMPETWKIVIKTVLDAEFESKKG